jgi:hypothetical protein
MTKWEYLLIDSKDAGSRGFLKGVDREDVEDFLNDLGQQGWEVIDIDFVHSVEGATVGISYFFGLAKRPIAG